MKLHLGCASKIINEFVNVDIREMEGVDVVDNIITLEKFQNETASLIYVSHVLEHTGRFEYMNVLKKWYEILKKGGILRIAVPDFEQVVNHYNKNRDLSLLRGFLWGGQTYEQNYHYMGWDFDSLKTDLEKVGFKNIKRYDWRNTEHSYIDDFSQCYLPHMDKENGMLMSLNIEAIK